jgi:hypothetical protein
VIEVRDSISKSNIPGPSEGSYMVTEHRYPFVGTAGSIGDNYTFIVKGLWKTEGDFMGGPFTTYAIYNESRNQVLIIDAFVYSPKLDKKEYVRQLDAIVHALEFKK